MKKKKNARIPDDVVAAFASRPEADRVFQDLPPSHKMEYVKWVSEAKKPDTRHRRILKTVEMVLAKR